MGNEGDDWIEGGTSDGAPGDNFDPLGLDPIAGNDVYIGSGENDKFNGEGGDDIMVGSPASATATSAPPASTGRRSRTTRSASPSTSSTASSTSRRCRDRAHRILARFDGVEGLSGSRIRRRHLPAMMRTRPRCQPSGARGSVLTNFALIDGLQELLDQALRSHRRRRSPAATSSLAATAATSSRGAAATTSSTATLAQRAHQRWSES